MSEYLPLITTNFKSETGDNSKQIIKNIIEGLSQQGIQAFYLDGREISSKETFFIKVAEAMEFPADFGGNWDAFDECITDLRWCLAEGYILFYDRPDIFAHADPTQWQIALDILRSAEEYWETRNTSLKVLLLN